MQPDLVDRIQKLLPELTEVRHDLHAHPEIAFDLPRTSELVAERLRSLGLQPRTGVGGCGITAVIPSDGGGAAIALRADMDALPMDEETGLPYASRTPGAMHACGHDGHTAILLGAAAVLAQLRERLPGPVLLIFQPAEEIVRGADAMIQAGALDDPRPAAIFGLHGWPGIPVGTVGLREGPLMASADTWDAVVRGKGGHAAHPEGTNDPIVASAQLITAWQTIVSRRTPAVSSVVLTVTRVEAGSAYNIIPPEARLAGTFRTLSTEMRERVPQLMTEIGSNICRAMGCSLELTVTPGTTVTVNHGGLARHVATVLGEDRVRWVEAPSMGGEDFGRFAEVVPGCFLWLGLGDRPFCHHPSFDFADDALPVGIEVLCRLALHPLPQL